MFYLEITAIDVVLRRNSIRRRRFVMRISIGDFACELSQWKMAFERNQRWTFPFLRIRLKSRLDYTNAFNHVAIWREEEEESRVMNKKKKRKEKGRRQRYQLFMSLMQDKAASRIEWSADDSIIKQQQQPKKEKRTLMFV